MMGYRESDTPSEVQSSGNVTSDDDYISCVSSTGVARCDPPEGLPTGLGWHEDREGRPVLVVKDATRLYSHMLKAYRTTWGTTGEGPWALLENAVDLRKCANKRGKVSPSRDLLIMRFDSVYRPSEHGYDMETQDEEKLDFFKLFAGSA